MHITTPFFYLGFENKPNRLYFVSTWLYTSFFVCTPFIFLPLSGRVVGTCYPPFLILNSKMGSMVCNSLRHDCIHLFSFVHLLLFYLSLGGGWLRTCYSLFSDFGFKNVLNHLYFVSTLLYTSFFVCTPLTFFYLFLKGLGTCYPLLFWYWIRKWAQLFVFRHYVIVYIFFVCTSLLSLPILHCISSIRV